MFVIGDKKIDCFLESYDEFYGFEFTSDFKDAITYSTLDNKIKNTLKAVNKKYNNEYCIYKATTYLTPI